MKRVLMSDDAATMVKRLRDSIGSYEADKIVIADALCKLTDMLTEGADISSDLQFHTESIIKVMGVLSTYNDLVDGLSEIMDRRPPKGILERTEEGEDREFNYAPNDKELEAIEKILADENIGLPSGVKLDELTFSEIADAAGFLCEELDSKVNRLRFGQKR
ncbi:MAG: hypothetical protein J6Q22_08055 [Prevotella sp.]|nr:hypothetical protein [Prevotella sp.]